MSVAIIHSRANAGIEAPAVSIEVHLSFGVPIFSIVGLPATAVKESKDRVRSALINSAFEFPTKRITVNLAPADLRKDGGRFDLPIALGILAASSQIPTRQLDAYEFAGELALSGAVRSIDGALPFALATTRAGRQLILPQENASEAALSRKSHILPTRHLLEVCAHFTGRHPLTRYCTQPSTTMPPTVRLEDVKGQRHAKRALEIAAAGGHSLLLVGPPGTGKTMLAARLPGILPPMTEAEALETASVYSIAGVPLDLGTWRQRPFRAPHHTSSSAALVGGSSPPKPGEISLAHHGVLFLDELPEFKRPVLESLREPLESGVIRIARAAHQACFPARFQLVTAMNPCPCGYLGDNRTDCRCTPNQIQYYFNKLSGPFLDRIDMQVTVPPLPKGILLNANDATVRSSADIQHAVMQAHGKQLQRAQKPNAQLGQHETQAYCALVMKDRRFLEESLDRLRLSARVCHRILRIARTIADLDDASEIQRAHLSEALSYRPSATYK